MQDQIITYITKKYDSIFWSKDKNLSIEEVILKKLGPPWNIYCWQFYWVGKVICVLLLMGVACRCLEKVYIYHTKKHADKYLRIIKAIMKKIDSSGQTFFALSCMGLVFSIFPYLDWLSRKELKNIEIKK